MNKVYRGGVCVCVCMCVCCVCAVCVSMCMCACVCEVSVQHILKPIVEMYCKAVHAELVHACTIMA